MLYPGVGFRFKSKTFAFNEDLAGTRLSTSSSSHSRPSADSQNLTTDSQGQEESASWCWVFWLAVIFWQLYKSADGRVSVQTVRTRAQLAEERSCLRHVPRFDLQLSGARKSSGSDRRATTENCLPQTSIFHGESGTKPSASGWLSLHWFLFDILLILLFTVLFSQMVCCLVHRRDYMLK